MPHLEVVTSVAPSKVPEDFLKTSTALIAKLLSKPESYCVISVHPGAMMAWGGKEEPCAIVRLMSLGGLGVAENQKYSKAISEHLQKSLGLPNDRVYIEFIDHDSADLGYQGTTFKALFG